MDSRLLLYLCCILGRHFKGTRSFSKRVSPRSQTDWPLQGLNFTELFSRCWNTFEYTNRLEAPEFQVAALIDSMNSDNVANEDVFPTRPRRSDGLRGSFYWARFVVCQPVLVI